MDVLIDDFWKDQTINGQKLTIPGYFVQSTAPINIEEDERKVDDTLPTIQDIVECLYQNRKNNPSFLGLVIQIHGYNTGIKKIIKDGREVEEDYIRDSWAQICQYLNQRDAAIQNHPNSFVYLGYRWPSESVPSNIRDSLQALPFLLRVLFWGGLLIAAIGFFLILGYAHAALDALFTLLVALGTALAMLVGSLFLLRTIVYFRDAYRANNFGVPDLVEFIRQLDQELLKRTINDGFFSQVEQALAPELALDPQLLRSAILKTWEKTQLRPELLSERNDEQFRSLLPKLQRGALAKLDEATFLKIYASLQAQPQPTYTAEDYAQAQAFWDDNEATQTKGRRIRLTFIGHSMGGFVTTQAVRILSDVFDPNSIGSVNTVEKLPPSNLGRVFCLGRLVLVSPDIPVKAIVSGRTNFLRSSIRRFEETYLFSNEGDLALRLASTAANYFSFPASTRTQGYRLGNVTVNLPKPNQNVYGIVNLSQLQGDKIDHLLKYIGIEVFNRQDQGLEAKRKTDPESISVEQKDPESIADLFTYFDCTEYRDKTDYPGRVDKVMNVLICDKQRSPLNLGDYTKLLKAYIDFSGNTTKGIDVHGGYFYGYFSKALIYRLAFLGFQGLLDSLLSESPEQLNINPPNGDLKADLDKIAHLDRQQQREVALKYFSWICDQKLIQVAASSERYYVDVLGLDRASVRAGILTKEKAAAETLPSGASATPPAQ